MVNMIVLFQIMLCVCIDIGEQFTVNSQELCFLGCDIVNLGINVPTCERKLLLLSLV